MQTFFKIIKHFGLNIIIGINRIHVSSFTEFIYRDIQVRDI